jgi:hypothetical protein
VGTLVAVPAVAPPPKASTWPPVVSVSVAAVFAPVNVVAVAVMFQPELALLPSLAPVCPDVG